MLWVTPYTCVVVVCFFFLLVLHQIGGPPWRQKWKSASASKYSSFIKAIIKFHICGNICTNGYFSVLWIERTWWIKNLQRKSYLIVFLSIVMRWVLILWWVASNTTVTSDILIWKVEILKSLHCLATFLNAQNFDPSKFRAPRSWTIEI